MCEQRIFYFALFAVFLFYKVSAEIYYVWPDDYGQPCPGQFCRTLSEYAAEPDIFSSTTTLMFLDGEHVLSQNFYIQDINQLSLTIASNNIEAVTISCSNYGDNFVIIDVQEVSLRGLVLAGCYGNRVMNASTLSLEDSRFHGLWNGSQVALHTSDIENIDINNCSFMFYEVKTYDGILGCSALYFNLSNVNIAYSNFFSCSAEYLVTDKVLSSTVCAFGCELTIVDSSFEHNRAMTGGAIYAERSAISVLGSTFTNNSAVYGSVLVNSTKFPLGGVGYFSHTTNVTIYNCTFSDNLSEAEGGVMYIDHDSTVEIEDCLFLYNTASLDTAVTSGGCLVVKQNSVASVYNSSFVGNSAQRGGVITAYISSHIYLSNSTFDSNKAFMNALLSNDILDERGSSYGGVINADNDTFINISGCVFTNNYAFTSGGAVYINYSSIFITERNEFTNNSAVYYGGAFTVMNKSNISINTGDYQNCDEGIYLTEFSNNSAEHGGAMNIILLSMANIQCARFINNAAQMNTSKECRGGAILARTNATIYLTRTYFSGNEARGKGAVLFSQFAVVNFDEHLIVDSNKGDFGVVYLSRCNATLKGNITFSNNENSFLAHGSNVIFTGETQFSGGMVVSDSDIHIEGNGDIEGGAITALRSTIEIWGSFLVMNNNAKFGGGMLARDSTIINYGLCTFYNNSAKYGGGLYAFNSEIHFRGNTTFEDNKAPNGNGGGIIALSSTIEYFSHYSYLLGNTAQNGGGIYLDRTSSLYIMKENMECNKSIEEYYERWYCVTPDEWMNLNFSDNCASEKGGALFVNDTGASSCNSVASDSDSDPIYGECFIQSIAVYESANDWNTSDANFKNIYFSNNTAKDGNILYGGLLDRCVINRFAEQRQILGNQFVLDPLLYLSNMSDIDISNSELSSDPMRICFCEDNNNVFNCNSLPPEINVVSGKKFNISVIVVDQAGKPIASEVEAYLSSTSAKLGENEGKQLVSATCKDLGYSIFSMGNEILNLYPTGSCSDHGISRSEIGVNLNSTCPIGFAMSNSSLECECDPAIQEFVTDCSIDSESVIREGDFWISAEFDENTKESVGFVIHNYCPYDYCYPATKKIEMNLNFENGSDAQCSFNRSGILCGGCKDNYSLTLGSSMCKDCSNSGLLLIIPFGLAGICLVAFMMMCNLTLAAGTLSGPLFYANILIANRATFFPFNVENVLTVFVSWLGLNLGISTCFYNGMDAIRKMWVQISFEVYLVILALLVILLGRSAKVCAFFHKYHLNPVNTLATLMMLSYEKLSRKIFSLLAFTHLKYSNGSEIVWLFDPNENLFKNRHIPLAIVAILILAGGVIFNASLLFNKLIIAKSRFVNANKFLEAFYAPLKSNHQYWVGLLLLIRNISYFTSEFLSAGKNPNYSLSFIFVLVVTILGLKLVYASLSNFKCCNLTKRYEPILPPLRDEENDNRNPEAEGNQCRNGEAEEPCNETGIVYKSFATDLLESSFLMNISVLTYFTLYIGGVDKTQSVLFYVSSSIALVTFVGILIYHFYTYTFISIYLRNKISSRREEQQRVAPAEDYGSLAVAQPNPPTKSEVTAV